MRECPLCLSELSASDEGRCSFCGVGLSPRVDHAAPSQLPPTPLPVAGGFFVERKECMEEGGEPPFYGRTEELAALVGFLTKPKDGNDGPAVAHITGEAGIGKTRLLREALARVGVAGTGAMASSCPLRVIEWKCSDWSQGILLHPVLDWLREELGLEADATSTAVSEAIWCYYAEYFPKAESDPLYIEYLFGIPKTVASLRDIPAERLQRNLFAAIRQLLFAPNHPKGFAIPSAASGTASPPTPRRNGEEAPEIVLVVEDLHWADALTMRLVQQLIRWPREYADGREKPGAEAGGKEPADPAQASLPPCGDATPSVPPPFGKVPQFIFLYRSGVEPPLSGDRGHLRLHLQPLEEKERWALIERLVPTEEFLPELRRALFSRAPGNPLFIREMTRLVREFIQANNDLNGENLTNRIIEVIPVSLRDLVQRRIELLDARSLKVLQCLSLLGLEFSAGLIELFDQLREGLNAHVQALVALRYIEEHTTTYGIRYRFTHSVLRDAAYSTLSEDARTSLHAHIGRCLTDVLGDRVREYDEMLAFHFARGGVPDKAVYHHVKAADRQAGLGAPSAGLGNYGAAMELLRDLPPSPARQALMARILVRSARLRRLQGELDTAEELLAGALECAEALRNEHLVLQARLEQAILKTWRGGINGSAAGELEGLAAEAARLQNPVAEIVALNALGMHHWQHGEMEPALRAFQGLARRCGESGALQVQADAFNNAGLIYWRWGQLPQALRALKRALPLRRRVGDFFGLCATIMNIGIVLENLGRIPGARRAYQKALALAGKTAYAQGMAALESNLSNLERRVGTLAAALEHAVQAVHHARGAGDLNLLSIAEHNLALAHTALPGQERQAEEHFALALEAARTQGNPERELSIRLDMLERELGRRQPGDCPDSLVAEVEEILGHIEQRHYPDLLPKARRLRGELIDLSGADVSGAKARELLEQARRQAGEMGNLFEEIDCLGALIAWAERHREETLRRQWRENLAGLFAGIANESDKSGGIARADARETCPRKPQ